MAEFKMPKYKCKGDTITLDECYRELSELAYKSPVEIIHQGFEIKLEGDIYKAIRNYGVIVDKDELIKALKYDRNQYEQGFVDGSKSDISTIKAKVAKEIFADTDEIFELLSVMTGLTFISDKYAKIKKKYRR